MPLQNSPPSATFTGFRFSERKPINRGAALNDSIQRFSCTARRGPTWCVIIKDRRKDIEFWRRKRDSNPRTSYPVNGFQDRRLQPLGHSSTLYRTAPLECASSSAMVPL